MDDSEKLNDTSLPETDEFYIHLYMDYITDADYMHVKRIFRSFKIKMLGKYRDFKIKNLGK